MEASLGYVNDTKVINIWTTWIACSRYDSGVFVQIPEPFAFVTAVMKLGATLSWLLACGIDINLGCFCADVSLKRLDMENPTKYAC